MATTDMKEYSAKSIQVLKGLEPVRKRPAMYIGGVDARGLHHCAWEILDNSVDEVMNGFGDTIEVILDADGEGLRISDNGRGIPVDLHPETKRPAIETIFTTLHAGGKFESGNYRHSGGLHGVGASVVNALSATLIATVRRDGYEYEQRFRRGKPDGGLKTIGKARGTGTSVWFELDTEIFPKIKFDPERLREVLEARAYLHRGMKVIFEDRTSKRKDVFRFEEGIKEYLRRVVEQRKLRLTADFLFYLEGEAETKVEVALQWTDETSETILSYVNGVSTPEGGTHVLGLRAAIVRAVRNYIDAHELAPRGVTLTAEDIREGLVVILSVYCLEPQFQGQTKDKLNNPDVQNHVLGIVAPALEKYFNSNATVANAIVGRAVLAARARAASREAALEVTRKTAVSSRRLNLPGKLADCESGRPDECELFIVEGDSAGGSAKQARERRFQAVLPLRGKVLNTEQAALSKVVQNKELSDIVSALGCGMGKSFDVSKLRYHKVIILTDADSDGHHIATLLLTFFYRHLPELVQGGFVYIGRPPLYRIDHGKETLWAWSDPEKEAIGAKLGGRLKEDAITRFKGLGEMSPDQLRTTTMAVSSRSLERVRIDDILETDKIVNELMGKDASARYRFVMEEGRQADDLDL
jgi:DNA gyrase/topoisomerase IV subunit B